MTKMFACAGALVALPAFAQPVLALSGPVSTAVSLSLSSIWSIVLAACVLLALLLLNRPERKLRLRRSILQLTGQRSADADPGLFYRTAATPVSLPLSPDDYFDKVRDLVMANFSGSTEEFALVAASLPRPFKSFPEAAQAASRALEALGDGATYLFDAAQTAELVASSSEPGSVTWKVVGNVGVLKIAVFDCDRLVGETRSALASMSGVEGYVLDLSGNPGGYIQYAFDVFALLADEGEFAVFAGTKPKAFWLTASEAFTRNNGIVTKVQRRRNYTGNKPLIVLVDGSSASASELLASALREHRQAVLVGERTLGKWTSQHIWHLDRGTSLAITTSCRIPAIDGGLLPCHESVPVELVGIPLAQAMSTVYGLSGGNYRLARAAAAIIYRRLMLQLSVEDGTQPAPAAWNQLKETIDGLNNVGELSAQLFEDGPDGEPLLLLGGGKQDSASIIIALERFALPF